MSLNSFTNIEQIGLHNFVHGFREKVLPRPDVNGGQIYWCGRCDNWSGGKWCGYR